MLVREEIQEYELGSDLEIKNVIREVKEYQIKSYRRYDFRNAGIERQGNAEIKGQMEESRSAAGTTKEKDPQGHKHLDLYQTNTEQVQYLQSPDLDTSNASSKPIIIISVLLLAILWIFFSDISFLDLFFSAKVLLNVIPSLFSKIIPCDICLLMIIINNLKRGKNKVRRESDTWKALSAQFALGGSLRMNYVSYHHVFLQPRSALLSFIPTQNANSLLWVHTSKMPLLGAKTIDQTVTTLPSSSFHLVQRSKVPPFAFKPLQSFLTAIVLILPIDLIPLSPNSDLTALQSSQLLLASLTIFVLLAPVLHYRWQLQLHLNLFVLYRFHLLQLGLYPYFRVSQPRKKRMLGELLLGSAFLMLEAVVASLLAGDVPFWVVMAGTAVDVSISIVFDNEPSLTFLPPLMLSLPRFSLSLPGLSLPPSRPLDGFELVGCVEPEIRVGYSPIMPLFVMGHGSIMLKPYTFIEMVNAILTTSLVHLPIKLYFRLNNCPIVIFIIESCLENDDLW